MQVSRSEELGHTISIDACHWKRNRDGREAFVVNIFHEASRFHVALVLKEGEPSELGNLTAVDYIEAVRTNWFLFARAPAVIRVDSEGAFKSNEFREWCAVRGIEVQMAPGEAHWQIGIVEHHIRLLKNQLSLMEDEFPDATTDELVEHYGAGKVQVHQNPHSSKTTFIKNHFHQKPLSSKTTFMKKPISSRKHFHQKPLSSKTTFIKNHFHQKPISSKTTFVKKPLSSKTNFIRDHFHQKPFSSKTNFIKNQFHQRPLPVRGTHHPSKNNIVRVCVKTSRTEGPRRLHTNTAYAHLWGLSLPFC